MPKQFYLKSSLSLYFFVFIFYCLFYLKYLVKPLNIEPLNIQFAMLYLGITHLLIPLAVLLRIITFYRSYSLQNLLNIFVLSWLLFIPLIQLVFIGFDALGHQPETIGQFFNLLATACLFAISGGFFSLVLNFIFISILHLIKK